MSLPSTCSPPPSRGVSWPVFADQRLDAGGLEELPEELELAAEELLLRLLVGDGDAA